MKKSLTAITLVLALCSLNACKNNKFTKLKSGLEYKILKKGKGDKKITVGSMITMNVVTRLRDSVLYDTYVMNNKQPVPVTVSMPSFNGDLMEGLPMLAEGDSAIFMVPADSMARGGQLPPFIKKGDKLAYTVKIVSVSSAAEYQKKQQEADEQQKVTDDKLIQDYIAANHIQAQKTPSGIYYTIQKAGNGKHPIATDKVKVQYKGSLMDGKVFDSSYEKGEPVEFALNQVIPGWTEGIQLFEEGGKGQLIIPSPLAYGKNPPPGSGIEPNSVLIFDIELLKINASK
ncbi:MAG: hypothetical protein RIQ62_295 [Bacteroidota bacterium]|jgi:FKBP-type peptidyl-prolyl cis-trans isomerase